jgi:hypothetical protein
MNRRNLRLNVSDYRRLNGGFKISGRGRSKASRRKKYSTVLSPTSHEI